MQEQDPAKRIPKSLGTDAKILGTYTLTDAAVALFPGVLVVLLTQSILPASLAIGGYPVQTLTMPLAVVAIVLGVVLVSLTPTYLTSIDWLITVAGYHRTDDEIAHEGAKEFTQIEQVYPARGAIERTDGAFIGLVQVEPPTMALATEEMWAEKVASFADFLNTTVEFPIQIYSTTQAFPVDEYLDRYESRLTDEDVKGNPKLASLMESYLEWYRADLNERRMTIRDHYIIVSVTPDEVHFERRNYARTLGRIPLVGLLIRSLLSSPRVAERAALFDTLEDRLGRVQSGVRNIDGCHARVVDAQSATRVIADFWSGDSVIEEDIAHRLRMRPIVGKSA